MNTLDLIIQIILMTIGSGALGQLGYWLHKHHKANHTANALELAQKIATWSVARVANDSSLAMGQRRTAVVTEIQDILTKHGYHINIEALVGLAEATYQLYKKNGHKIVKPKPTPAPTVDNTTDGPYKHSVSGLTVDELNVLNNYRVKRAAVAK